MMVGCHDEDDRIFDKKNCWREKKVKNLRLRLFEWMWNTLIQQIGFRLCWWVICTFCWIIRSLFERIYLGKTIKWNPIDLLTQEKRVLVSLKDNYSIHKWAKKNTIWQTTWRHIKTIFRLKESTVHLNWIHLNCANETLIPSNFEISNAWNHRNKISIF